VRAGQGPGAAGARAGGLGLLGLLLLFFPRVPLFAVNFKLALLSIFQQRLHSQAALEAKVAAISDTSMDCGNFEDVMLTGHGRQNPTFTSSTRLTEEEVIYQGLSFIQNVQRKDLSSVCARETLHSGGTTLATPGPLHKMHKMQLLDGSEDFFTQVTCICYG
jgi:hypothetical protein